MNDRFVYVTYIRTTKEKLWEAITTPEFTRQFWFGFHNECSWQKGASWKLIAADGWVADAGEVLEIDPPNRLVLRWRNEFIPENKADGDTRCTFDITNDGDVVKLVVTHEADKPHRHIQAVSNGWPQVLSSLKTFLETGQSLPRTDRLPAKAA